jgi:hypothetical protein
MYLVYCIFARTKYCDKNIYFSLLVKKMYCVFICIFDYQEIWVVF